MIIVALSWSFIGFDSCFVFTWVMRKVRPEVTRKVRLASLKYALSGSLLRFANGSTATDLSRAVSVTALGGCERGDDLFEARVAAQRVPQRVQF
jgi:hypothetical protein